MYETISENISHEGSRQLQQSFQNKLLPTINYIAINETIPISMHPTSVTLVTSSVCTRS